MIRLSNNISQIFFRNLGLQVFFINFSEFKFLWLLLCDMVPAKKKKKKKKKSPKPTDFPEAFFICVCFLYIRYGFSRANCWRACFMAKKFYCDIARARHWSLSACQIQPDLASRQPEFTGSLSISKYECTRKLVLKWIKSWFGQPP